MMNVFSNTLRLARLASRGFRQFLTRRSGFVATEYGMAMAVVALGIFGGNPAIETNDRAVNAPNSAVEQTIERATAQEATGKLDSSDLFGAAVVARLVSEQRSYLD